MQYKEFLSIYDINYIKFKDGGKNKMKLDKFIGMMTGHFDNKEQFDIMHSIRSVLCRWKETRLRWRSQL